MARGSKVRVGGRAKLVEKAVKEEGGKKRREDISVRQETIPKPLPASPSSLLIPTPPFPTPPFPTPPFPTSLIPNLIHSQPHPFPTPPFPTPPSPTSTIPNLNHPQPQPSPTSTIPNLNHPQPLHSQPQPSPILTIPNPSQLTIHLPGSFYQLLPNLNFNQPIPTFLQLFPELLTTLYPKGSFTLTLPQLHPNPSPSFTLTLPQLHPNPSPSFTLTLPPHSFTLILPTASP
ncbi:hypothetical protein Pmani_029849 [Petrolisthes manimaculis]|uniref:Uncharacterized protein n=1 Tax=Petrolisthes manimaculis TaxID=1843537 RepID=A0AAE1NWV5_9EUCA|nr:hypothetical protein Pmani_029849 [Petrolisthes manimaculis]